MLLDLWLDLPELYDVYIRNSLDESSFLSSVYMKTWDVILKTRRLCCRDIKQPDTELHRWDQMIADLGTDERTYRYVLKVLKYLYLFNMKYEGLSVDVRLTRRSFRNITSVSTQPFIWNGIRYVNQLYVYNQYKKMLADSTDQPIERHVWYLSKWCDPMDSEYFEDFDVQLNRLCKKVIVNTVQCFPEHSLGTMNLATLKQKINNAQKVPWNDQECEQIIHGIRAVFSDLKTPPEKKWQPSPHLNIHRISKTMIGHETILDALIACVCNRFGILCQFNEQLRMVIVTNDENYFKVIHTRKDPQKPSNIRFYLLDADDAQKTTYKTLKGEEYVKRIAESVADIRKFDDHNASINLGLEYRSVMELIYLVNSRDNVKIWSLLRYYEGNLWSNKHIEDYMNEIIASKKSGWNVDA